VIEGTYSESHGQEAARVALEREHPPTALIAASNQLLIGAMREIARQKLRIGTDLSFVACDEISLTELAEPAIAVVERDNPRMGREAAQLLLRRLDGTAQAESVALGTRFIPRASCAPPRPGG